MTTDDDGLADVTWPVSTSTSLARPLRERAQDLLDAIGPDEEADRYGSGALIEDFEQRVAQLLGKPAAVFAPSGTMLQQIALRIWADRTGRRTVGMHPAGHLERHEFRAHEVLHGLRTVPLGRADLPLTLTDVEVNREPLGSLLLELPQREIGYVLPTWDELTTMVDHAREHEWVLHLDGARLWEAAPFYADVLGPTEQALPRIAELFDTVYVSLYKIVGGVAGGVLAGPEDVVDEARTWRRRHGGELINLWPLVVTARTGLDRALPRVAAFHERAVELSSALGDIDLVEPYPAPAHTNAFRLYLHGGVDAWTQAQREIAPEAGIGLAPTFHRTLVPSVAVTEVVVAEPAFEVDIADVVDVVARCAQRVAQLVRHAT